MSRLNAETVLSYHCLTVRPLVSNPTTELDRAVNKLQTRYSSYIVEYDINDGVVRLPSLFGVDFGDQVTRLATLIDSKENQFEVLVERINGAFFLSKGWKALQDFYGIRLGAWITLVYVGLGKFVILLKDRFGKVMRCHVFNPSMQFVIDKTSVQPTFNNNLPPFTASLSFRHDNNNFTLQLPKN